MSKFEFVSHQSFPEDEHTKEIVYLELNVPVRVAFVRKPAKTGGMFWSAVSTGALSKGEKQYFPAFMQDSNFLEKDIRAFLDNRGWEKQAQYAKSQSVHEKPQLMDEAQQDDGLPF